MATGSLGQGLPIGAGVALAGKRFDRLPYRVWVLCGNSEMAEGFDVGDHWPEGGLGDAVPAAFTGDPDPPTVVDLAVTEMPTSGAPAELLAAAGMDATAIATVRELLAHWPRRGS